MLASSGQPGCGDAETAAQASLKTKLSVLIVFATSVTMLIAAGAFFLYGVHRSRTALIGELSSVVEVIAAASAAAIQFTPLTPTVVFDNGSLLLARTIALEGRRTGVLCVRANTRSIEADVRKVLLWIVVGFMISVATAALLAVWIQRYIAGPILHLARTSKNRQHRT